MATHNRRGSFIDQASVQSILTSEASDHAAAPPNPHVGDSPNRELFPMDPPRRSASIKHARAMSYNPRKPNRLSLSFPVAPSANNNESARPTPTSSNPPSFPATPSQAAPTPSPTDPNSFLVALAAQERRVLELKEELEKAELDLKKLKKQWAYHEASKKRAEIRHSEPLQSLHTNMTEGESSEEGSTNRSSVDMDRRKALLSNIHKESRRKVLTGGHTRTLSLLSPDRTNYAQPFPFPPVQESGSEGDTNGIPRSTTMPDTSQGITKISSNRARHSYQGGVTHNAKQIAEDVKAGLWTFLEDLRQATVGDEAVNGTTNRASLDTATKDPKRRGSKGSLLSNERGKRGTSPRSADARTWDSLTGSNHALLDVAGTMWEEMDRSGAKSLTPLKQEPAARTLSTAPLVDELDDDWSNWDSPTPKSPRWSGSTDLTDPATPAQSNREGQSVSIVDQSADHSTPPKREEIQWPALDKLTPSHLKRTMSSMMKDWEKSLTPPSEELGDPINGDRERSTSPPIL
ncbi:hypothetical protein D0Z07_7514 [Hyphodiscus hymeniophilus]|uniref:DUF4048 domain-containing protein n=1 Tax=Hyphodiscus hymeniophilus TaxID=353542 RepID=A0A9P6VEM1_9HELO|nr:hypothetical protein D0Z07_7514 [Hyphodiscus hymeniophilus]